SEGDPATEQASGGCVVVGRRERARLDRTATEIGQEEPRLDVELQLPLEGPLHSRRMVAVLAGSTVSSPVVHCSGDHRSRRSLYHRDIWLPLPGPPPRAGGRRSRADSPQSTPLSSPGWRKF